MSQENQSTVWFLRVSYFKDFFKKEFKNILRINEAMMKIPIGWYNPECFKYTQLKYEIDNNYDITIDAIRKYQEHVGFKSIKSWGRFLKDISFKDYILIPSPFDDGEIDDNLIRGEDLKDVSHKDKLLIFKIINYGIYTDENIGAFIREADYLGITTRDKLGNLPVFRSMLTLNKVGRAFYDSDKKLFNFDISVKADSEDIEEQNNENIDIITEASKEKIQTGLEELSQTSKKEIKEEIQSGLDELSQGEDFGEKYLKDLIREYELSKNFWLMILISLLFVSIKVTYYIIKNNNFHSYLYLIPTYSLDILVFYLYRASAKLYRWYQHSNAIFKSLLNIRSEILPEDKDRNNLKEFEVKILLEAHKRAEDTNVIPKSVEDCIKLIKSNSNN